MESVQGKRYKRTLFVGLGGAGSKTLRILKKRFQLANDGEVPKQIKFLLIDTNATELSNFRDFDCSEKICIAVREPYQRYLHDKGTPTHEFIPEQNSLFLMALERGAGQIRSNGHFAVVENQYSNRLMRIFRERADELADIDVKESILEKDPKIEVRLVFSIAGGTGSGTFLPIATIIRAAINHCELTAYIYSATNFVKKVENSAKYSVMQNAYAALCELDYMMHFGCDGKHIAIPFNFGPSENQRIEQNNRPFEEVYYIDKHTGLPMADSVEFAYNEIDRLYENTADAMHIAASNIISAHTGTVDNVRQKIMEGQFDVSDKFAWVSGMGLAELYFNKLNKDDIRVIDACLNAIENRIADNKLDDSIIDDIASDFIKTNRYDESQGVYDGDPILNIFYDAKELADNCGKWVRNYAVVDESPNTIIDKLKIHLKDIIVEKGTNVQNIHDGIVDKFENQLNKLLQNLIDNNNDSNGKPVKGYTSYSGPWLTLDIISSIVGKIESCFDASISVLNREMIGHDDEAERATKEHKKLMSRRSTPAPMQPKRRLLGIIPVPGLKQQTLQNTTTYSHSDIDAYDYQIEAIYNTLLSERDSLTIKVLEACRDYAIKIKKRINAWKDMLQAVQKAGVVKRSTAKLCSEDSERKVNRVEVKMVDLKDGFHITYENFKELESERKKPGSSDNSIFTFICGMLTGESGDLHKYLLSGLDEIKKQAAENQVKVERTECQQKIDRLIDLSTPTMQIDSHGYGDKVKLDHFWYVMTDCPDANVAVKAKDGKEKKSVGELLKDLIEQNTQDARINLVHVPNWKNKAILYRVDSAVPAYFVDGVCVNSAGGHTLERCYEEMKKTRQSYTPFSHEILRKLLENQVCALKPMDAVEENKVLDYWLDYLMLHKISIRGGEGEDATYCIDSAGCGKRLSDQLDCRKHVLVLGKTRTEAYNTFCRYCGELIKEWKSYDKDIMKPFLPNDNPSKNVYQITSCEYIANKELHQYYGEIKELTKEDDDFIILDKEMTRLDKRASDYAERIRIKTLNEKLSNCDGSALSEYCEKLKASVNKEKND